MIVDNLLNTLGRDAKSFLESASVVAFYEEGDIAEEAEAHLSAIEQPVVCESCRQNTLVFPSVGFARIMFLENGIPQNFGWFRLCEKCYARGVAEDDPRQFERFNNGLPFDPFFAFLGRIFPNGDRSKYLVGYVYLQNRDKDEVFA